MMPKATRLKITDLNPHLTCVLCTGYYVDATTIIECLHSFCRSCIVKYLETSKFCPICDVQVHKTKPLMSIRSDKTLQDIVYKLVPGLFKGEMKRRRDYYSSNPDAVSSSASSLEDRGVQAERFIYTPDEDVSLSLEYWSSESKSLPNGDASKLMTSEEAPDAPEKAHRRYLQSPAAVTVAHLKKLIRNKYELPSPYQLDIIHQSDVLCDHYSLVDVAYIYSWRRNGPMRFFYRFEEPQPEPPPKRQKTCHEAAPEPEVSKPDPPRDVPCVVTSPTPVKAPEEPPAPKKDKTPPEKPPTVAAPPVLAPKRLPEGTASITITPIAPAPLPNGVSDKTAPKDLPPSPAPTPEPPPHGMVITKVTVEAPPGRPKEPLSLPVSLPLPSVLSLQPHPAPVMSVSVSLTPSPSPPVAAAAPSPKAPNVPKVPNMPNVPKAPNVPNVPNVPKVPKENGDVFVTTIVPITTMEPATLVPITTKEPPAPDPAPAKDSVVLVVVASKEPPEIPATNGAHAGGAISPSPPLHLPVPDISITPIPPRAIAAAAPPPPAPASHSPPSRSSSIVRDTLSTTSPQVEIIKKVGDATVAASAAPAVTTTIISTSCTDTTTTITITSSPASDGVVEASAAAVEDEEAPKHDNFGALDLSRGSRCVVSLRPLAPPKPLPPKPTVGPHPPLKTTIRAPQAHTRPLPAQARHALNVPSRSSHLPVSAVQMARPSMKAVSRIANGFVHRPFPQQLVAPPPPPPPPHHHHHHHHHGQNRPKQLLSPTGMMAVKYRCLPALDKAGGFGGYHNGDKVDSGSVNM